MNIVDFLDLLANWYAKGQPYDINKDGIIDNQDIQEMFDAWGVCPK